jgi:hypothetical protein
MPVGLGFAKEAVTPARTVKKLKMLTLLPIVVLCRLRAGMFNYYKYSNRHTGRVMRERPSRKSLKV